MDDSGWCPSGAANGQTVDGLDWYPSGAGKRSAGEQRRFIARAECLRGSQPGFVSLTRARGLPNVELQILRRAYEQILG